MSEIYIPEEPMEQKVKEQAVTERIAEQVVEPAVYIKGKG